MTLEELKAVYANPCMCVDVTDSGGTKHHMKCNRCFSIHNYFPALIRIIEAQREALNGLTCSCLEWQRELNSRYVQCLRCRALDLTNDPLEATE